MLSQTPVLPAAADGRVNEEGHMLFVVQNLKTEEGSSAYEIAMESKNGLQVF